MLTGCPKLRKTGRAIADRRNVPTVVDWCSDCVIQRELNSLLAIGRLLDRKGQIPRNSDTWQGANILAESSEEGVLAGRRHYKYLEKSTGLSKY